MSSHASPLRQPLDHLVHVARDRAHRPAELEHHVVGEVGDAVADDRRPAGAGAAQELEALLRRLEPRERVLRRRRVAERRLLGLEPGAHHRRDRPRLVRRAGGGAGLGRGDDLVAELLDEHREAAVLVELAVLAGERLGAHDARHGDHRDAQAVPLEVAAVELGDALPLRVEVDLRQREHHRRAQLGRPAQEVDLRCRQLGGGVGHEDQTVGERAGTPAWRRRGRRRGRPCPACRRRRGPA